MGAGSEAPPLLRTSERNDFKRCPWLWHESWVKGLRTRREPTWAWFGTAIHRGLEARYPVGDVRGSLGDMIDAFEEALGEQERRVYTEGLLVDEEEIVNGRELGRAMLRGYVEEYGEDRNWTVLHTEQPFQIDVPDPIDPSKTLVVYAGTWDLAIYDNNEHGYGIVDHKTRKSFPKLWNFYNINDQAGSYLWVAKEVLVHKGILRKKDSIEWLIFNALKKSLPDTRPRNSEGLATNKPKKEHYEAVLRKAGIEIPKKATISMMAELAAGGGWEVLGDVSAVQPAELFHREKVWRSPAERVTQARRVQAEAQVMAQMRAGTLPLYKTPTEDCTRCPLFEYCELHEQNPEEAAEFAAATLVHRDPYRDHREAMAEGGVEIATATKTKKTRKKAARG